MVKYKPAKDTGGAPVVASNTATTGNKNEETKSDNPAATKEDLIFDMDTGNTYTREEYAKIK